MPVRRKNGGCGMSGERKVIVVGGGAAGMMAAITAAETGASVTVVERNPFCGKKLRITGKGRCNLTNDCTPRELMENIPTNPRFLYAAFSRFTPEDTRDFFESAGVPLKTERGRRVFPVSDKAADVVTALTRRMRDLGVSVEHADVRSVLVENGGVCGVATGQGLFCADAVILATGGCSYPLTGSDGSGYRLAQALGHTIVPQTPSLVPLVAAGKLCASMQGLSLRNVGLRIVRVQDQKSVYEDFGEMMFTHFGLTGPMILSASAHLRDLAPGKYEAWIDLKPALDEKTLDARLLSDFGRYANREFDNALHDLLPAKMIPVLVELSGIDPHKKVNLVTREERRHLAELFKCFRIPLLRTRPIAEAIVTRGGVAVDEIDPRRMASKRVGGLYFAGEMIDVDAYTGGYNLQIAWSTGYAAGKAAAEQVLCED